jgi:hypothetical protein
MQIKTSLLLFCYSCFEKSKQAHSISCKKFRPHTTNNDNPFDFKSDSVTSFASAINSLKPKTGILTEYQKSYHPNIKEPSKMVPVKLKDTLTFGNKSLFEDPYKVDPVGSIHPSSAQKLRRYSHFLLL